MLDFIDFQWFSYPFQGVFQKKGYPVFSIKKANKTLIILDRK
jgi:hypothetical protein